MNDSIVLMSSLVNKSLIIIIIIIIIKIDASISLCNLFERFVLHRL